MEGKDFRKGFSQIRVGQRFPFTLTVSYMQPVTRSYAMIMPWLLDHGPVKEAVTVPNWSDSSHIAYVLSLSSVQGS